MGKKIFFKLLFYIAASALKSCLIKKFKKLKKKFGRIFFGLKTVFFRASCFCFSTYRVSPWLLSTVSLIQLHLFKYDNFIKHEISFIPELVKKLEKRPNMHNAAWLSLQSTLAEYNKFLFNFT
jgi:hypothetical protein